MASSLGVEHKGGVTGLVKKRNDIPEEDRVFHQNKEANVNMAKMFGNMVMSATDGKKVKPSELRKKGAVDPKLQQAVEESKLKAAAKKRAEDEASKKREEEEKSEALRKVESIKQAIAAKPKEEGSSKVTSELDTQSPSSPILETQVTEGGGPADRQAGQPASQGEGQADSQAEQTLSLEPVEAPDAEEGKSDRKSDADGDTQNGTDSNLLNDEPASPRPKETDSDDEADHLSEEQAKKILAMGALFKKLELLAYLKPFLVWQYDVESLKNITPDDLSTLIADREARQRLIEYLATSSAHSEVE